MQSRAVDQGDPAVLAAAYLESLPVGNRRSNGQVYTPDYLASFILKLAGFAKAQADASTLLDPACGAGVFLRKAVSLVAQRAEAELGSISGSNRAAFLKLVANTLYGVDVDPRACELAREAVRNTVLRHSPGPLPKDYFEKNVVEGDFLLGSTAEKLPPARSEGFSFIVGNPPYVPATRLAADLKDSLRRSFQTAIGRIDLYTLFIEKSLKLLRPRGRLAMVTPDKFLSSETSRHLRQYILSAGALRTIARFRSHKVFEDAATVPCITVIERDGRPTKVEILSCDDKLDERLQVRVMESATIDHSKLGSSAWNLKPPQFNDLVDRIQKGHPTLAELTTRISAGPATGRDSVYVVPALIAAGIERELLRPVVRGRDIQANGISESGLSILLPYRFRKEGPELVDLREYPKAKRYLESYKQELVARHCVRVWEKAWYDLHDSPAIDLARQGKILVPDVAENNRFAVDTGRFFPVHSAYYLIPKPEVDSNLLAAILNSRVSEFLIRLHAPIVKDGFSRYRKQFLACLPIPQASRSEAAAILKASRSGDSETADKLVSRLFGLSTQDIERMGRFLRAAMEGAPA